MNQNADPYLDVSSFPIETCHAHVAPPGPTGAHLDFHLATEVKIPRRFRGSSTPRHEKRHPMPFGKQVTWQVTLIFVQNLQNHVSSCLIMSLCFGDANAGTQMQTIRMMTMMAHTACCSQQSHGRPTASRHPFSVHWGAWESLFEAQLRAIVCPVSFHIFHGFAHVSIPFLFHVFPCKSWWALHRVRILVSRSTIAWKDFKPSRSARTTSRFPLRTTKMMKHQYQTVSMCFVWSNFADSNFWISDFSSKLSKLLSC